MIVSAIVLNTAMWHSTHTVLNALILRRIQYGMARALIDRIENGAVIMTPYRIKYG
jgi:hypothetical protein